jgi:hypothetical protein
LATTKAKKTFYFILFFFFSFVAILDLFKPAVAEFSQKLKRKGCLLPTLHNSDNQGWLSFPKGLSQIGQHPISRMPLCSATR